MSAVARDASADGIITLLLASRADRKTQMVPWASGGAVRNRFTHSLEVARWVDELNRLLPPDKAHDPALLLEVALLHDIGHPPFGHVGERVLDRLARAEGGFESNAHTVHILIASAAQSRVVEASAKYSQVIPAVDQGRSQLIKGIYAADAALRPAVPAAAGTRSIAALVALVDDLTNAAYDLADVSSAVGVDVFVGLVRSSPVRVAVLAGCEPRLTVTADRVLNWVADLFQAAGPEADFKSLLDGKMADWLQAIAVACTGSTMGPAIPVPQRVHDEVLIFQRIVVAAFIDTPVNRAIDKRIADILTIAWSLPLSADANGSSSERHRCQCTLRAHQLQSMGEDEILDLVRGRIDVSSEAFQTSPNSRSAISV